ncbi:hypothetical protein DDE18_20045 [Nocardioides gansuensis]|uniref:DUF1707 domain-containing protein n=1 Tax=Nocardioides gansuensis TaxID=2138300 RepID=A0A2T8F5X4_9ACTN|nr:hypothetical protein DDE18_20045 [Nocardioides gansuensis]
MLSALTTGADSVVELHVALQVSQAAVLEALETLMAAGLVVRTGDDPLAGYRLTPAGSDGAGGRSAPVTVFGSNATFSFTVQSTRDEPQPDLAQLGDMVGKAWKATRVSRELERAEREKGLLVGDVERESALSMLAQAFGEGRLDQAEHDRRLDLALHAETRGELDRAVEGLHLPTAASTGTPARSAIWFLVALALPVLVVGLLVLTADGFSASQKALAGLALLGVPALLAATWLVTRPEEDRRRHWRGPRRNG